MKGLGNESDLAAENAGKANGIKQFKAQSLLATQEREAEGLDFLCNSLAGG